MINTQYLKKDTLNYASCSFDKQALILTIFSILHQHNSKSDMPVQLSWSLQEKSEKRKYKES